eukprot:g56665.t1
MYEGETSDADVLMSLFGTVLGVLALVSWYSNMMAAGVKPKWPPKVFLSPKEQERLEKEELAKISLPLQRKLDSYKYADQPAWLVLLLRA